MTTWALIGLLLPVFADVSLSWNFEDFTTGPLDGQEGWVALPGDSLCGGMAANAGRTDNPSIVFEPGTTNHVMRISNQEPAQCLWAAAAPTLMLPGGGLACSGESTEALAYSYGLCPDGSRLRYFQMEFDFKTESTAFQGSPGDTSLRTVVSIDSGKADRMSAIILQDMPQGTDIHFSFVLGETNPADFEEIVIANVPRGVWHHVSLVVQFPDGEDNDLAYISIDNGAPVTHQHSWENYYRHDSEQTISSGVSASRTTSTVSWRIKDDPMTTITKGFFFDNVHYQTAASPAVINPCLYHNGGCDPAVTCSYSFVLEEVQCGRCPGRLRGSGKTGCNTFEVPCRTDADCSPRPQLYCSHHFEGERREGERGHDESGEGDGERGHGKRNLGEGEGEGGVGHCHVDICAERPDFCR